MEPLSDNSDRLLLTVRICRDGNREWLDNFGRVALVFFEKGKWQSRPNNRTPFTFHNSEQEALDALLNDDLRKLRSKFKSESIWVR
jgi:transcriptional/translational regulatory protein YebC/TACO1